MEKEENTELDSEEQTKEPTKNQAKEQELENNQENPEESESHASEDRISELEKEVDQNRNKYLRAIADLENYKKRVLKERSELIKYSGESVIIDFLDVLDDLDRACSAEATSVEKVIEGVEMIQKRLEGVFKKHSVESKDYLGEDFDPNCHEALTTVPTDEHPVGKVMEQLKKAYFFKDKLIRPAQVVVSAKKEE